MVAVLDIGRAGTDATHFSREVSDEDRARWISVAENLRDDPSLLVTMRERDPELAEKVSRSLRILAIKARADQWRSPIKGIGGRKEQLIPGTEGSFSDRTDWLTWLLVGGRGSGKSRTGAEAVRELILGRRWKRPPMVALVGQTLEDVRVTMVENTLLQVLPSWTIRRWNRGPCELWLTNGAYLKGYSSETPRKLRGPNFHLAWADELATWSDAHRSPNATDTTWSNLKLAVRAGREEMWRPRLIATTTPKAVNLLRNVDPKDPLNPGVGLYDDGLTVRSHMSSLANLANLSPTFFEQVIQPLEGTRLYAQEVEGELIDETLGALWSSELIEQMRRSEAWPEHQAGGIARAVVAVDPSVGGGRGDECGIVVVGLCGDGRAYVLEDASLRGPSTEWAPKVWDMFVKWEAEAVIAEVNHGGELVTEVLGRENINLPVVEVRGKKAKRLRAEPIALLSDKDRVRFAGEFRLLERQMRTWTGEDGQDSPDRLDAFVYGCLYLLPVYGGADSLITVRRVGAAR